MLMAVRRSRVMAVLMTAMATEEPLNKCEEVVMAAMIMAEICWADNKAAMGAWAEDSSMAAWVEMEWDLLSHSLTCSNNKLLCMVSLTWVGALVVTCMACRGDMRDMGDHSNLNSRCTSSPMDSSSRDMVVDTVMGWGDLRVAMTRPMVSMVWALHQAMVSSSRCLEQG